MQSLISLLGNDIGVKLFCKRAPEGDFTPPFFLRKKEENCVKKLLNLPFISEFSCSCIFAEAKPH